VERLEDRLTPAVATPSQNFVSQAYVDLLGRQVDPAGLAFWSKLVDSGVSRTQVTFDILMSPEYLTNRLINPLYQKALNRGVDPGGLAFWEGFLQGGGRLEQVALGILDSPEFLAAHGNTNDGWLTGAYAALGLGNPAGTVDVASRIGWDAVFAEGVPLQEVASVLVAGIQYEQDAITSFYDNLLHRAPDAAGASFWLGVDQAAGQLFVLANIVGSPEYFQDAQANPAPVPTISALSTTTGFVNSQVKITGTFLNINPAVTIAGANIPASSFTIVSAGEIDATIPTGAPAGTGPVTVTTPFGTASSASNFTIGPGISSFAPTSGQQGTQVTIQGSNFTGATAVTIDGLTVPAAGFSVDTDSQITIKGVPTGGTVGSSGPVTVTTAFGTATSTSNYTLTAAGSPTITTFTPSGSPGATVTINGSKLSGASVTFAGPGGTTVSATIQTDTDSQIQVTVPSGGINGNIVVTTAGGTASTPSIFSYPATVTGFSPSTTAQGSSITITGTNLLGATSVVFTGTATSVSPTVIDNNTIQVTVPAGATSGTVTVTTGAGAFVSSTSLTVIPPPTLSGSVTGDNETATVTINGNNLSNATVTFGGTTATIQTNTSSQIVFSLASIASVVRSSLPTGGNFSFTVSTAGGSVGGTFIFAGETDGDTINDADDIVSF
jgi:hypothetical protein